VLTWYAEGSDETFQAITIFLDNSFLALCGESDRHVRVFDLRSSQPHLILEHTAEWSVEHVSFRSDGRSGRSRGLGPGQQHPCLEVPKPRTTRVVCVAISPQNDLVACLEWAQCSLVDAISGETVVQWLSKLHTSWPQISVAWSTDETRLLTCTKDGMVRVWDVASARALKQVRLLFQFNTEHRATVGSFIDGHRCIATDHGVFPILPEHRPPCAAADLEPPSQEALLRLRDDGWIWRVQAGRDERRLCWLPLVYRPLEPTVGENVVVTRDIVRLLADSGRIVVLECTRE